MNTDVLASALIRAGRRLGLVGVLGLGLLGLAAWGHWTWLPRQAAEAAQLASDARGLRHNLQSEASGARNADQSGAAGPAQAWQSVWMALPRSDRRMALQSAVLQAARAQGLQLTNVQYQGAQEAWARQGGETLWRQRMAMPVQGPHAAVQAWIQALLKEPALSLDALSIQRDRASSDAVVAQLGVSLWWRMPVGDTP